MKHTRKILSVLLVLVLTLALAAPALAADDEPGTKWSDWARPELEEMFDSGGFVAWIGKDLTRPITRREFLTLAVQSWECWANVRDTTVRHTFDDIGEDEGGYMAAAHNLGLLTGYSDTKAAPEDGLTREQGAALVMRTVRLLKCDKNLPATVDDPFPNDTSISSWARADVARAAHESIGLFSGVGEGMFNAQGSITVEQSLLVFNRLYNLYLMVHRGPVDIM